MLTSDVPTNTPTPTHTHTPKQNALAFLAENKTVEEFSQDLVRRQKLHRGSWKGGKGGKGGEGRGGKEKKSKRKYIKATVWSAL